MSVTEKESRNSISNKAYNLGDMKVTINTDIDSV